MPDPSLRQGVGPEEPPWEVCEQMDGRLDKRWEGSFPWDAQAKHLLQDFFGSRDFRLNQRQAINATLSGKDSFVLMPTGGGGLSSFFER